MNSIVSKFANFIVNEAPTNNKDEVIRLSKEKFNLTQDRKVYYCQFFAVRFSYSKNGSFSNTVLSLSQLQKYDNIPFLVVLVVHNQANYIYLANSSFLKKISHSSKELRIDNIKGSFNGSDIMKTYNNIDNCAKNIEELFSYHSDIPWNDNLERLVEATSEIVPTSSKYAINSNDRQKILSSINRAIDFCNSNNFTILEKDLNERVNKIVKVIPIISLIENVNIRGRLIEALITSDDIERNSILEQLKKDTLNLPVYDTKNGLGDYVREFKNGKTLTDVKTKVIYLNSNPKAYNIDKFLEIMCEKNTIFFFFFVGIDKLSITNSILCSVYDSQLLDATIIQEHWSGRGRRGSTQFIGNKIGDMLETKKYINKFEKKKIIDFLNMLMDK